MTKSDKVVVTIDGTEYTTEDLFGQLATSNATGVAAYYNAISEVIVRNATRSYAESTELKKAVDASVDQLKEEAHNNADANGTSYKKEWNAILENKGVESEKELIEQLTYNELQSHLQDEYYDLNSDELLEDYLNEMLPYHVRHILVKVSASAGTLARGTITQSEALKLASVVRRMANLNEDGTVKKTTETFGEVAFQASEDTGSASLYGNLDVMTTSTSFVNEFKLGIYAYESLFAHKMQIVVLNISLTQLLIPLMVFPYKRTLMLFQLTRKPHGLPVKKQSPLILLGMVRKKSQLQPINVVKMVLVLFHSPSPKKLAKSLIWLLIQSPIKSK